MISRKTIALSIAALAVSASAAMAATTHHRPTPRHVDTAAAASYAAAPNARYVAAPHYYDADDNGSVWANYPGYVPIARN
jgi:hypothetical protein